MKPLRIALIPMLLSETRDLYQSHYQRYMTPLAPIALASYLESLELPLEILVHDKLENVLQFQPDLVGISAVSENFGFAQKIAQTLKEKINPFIIIGGPHITAWPQFLPDCFDLGVIGEGEKTLEEIVKLFLQEGPQKTLYKNIPGLVMKTEDKIFISPGRSQIENLNELPIPQRKRWVKHLGVPHIMTTRGCVYRCSFCAEPSLFKKYREFSPGHIVEEIESILQDYPETKHIRFYDDIFTVNRKRLQQLVELAQAHKIPEKISFSAFIHVKLFDDEIAQLLKKLNFLFIQFGADSGSPKILSQIKPSATLDLNQKTLNTAEKAGLKIGGSLVIGTPQENPEDLKQTLQFARKNKKKLFDLEVSPAVALPGTDLWSYAQDKNLIPSPEKINWFMFRDFAHLKNFDFDDYLYIAEQIPREFFFSHLKKFSDLIEEVHQIHGTKRFLTENYFTHYHPATFYS